MLEEKITKVFEEEYGTVLNIEPDFDEIFKPREAQVISFFYLKKLKMK